MTSVKVDPAYVFGADTVVPTSRYVVHPDRGVIQAVGGPVGRRRCAADVEGFRAPGARIGERARELVRLSLVQRRQLLAREIPLV